MAVSETRPRPGADPESRAWALQYEATGSVALTQDWSDSFASEVLEALPPGAAAPGPEWIRQWLDAPGRP